MKFLDTNVILRFLTRDDEEKADACLRLFQQVQRGDEELLTCEAIVCEVVYVLSSRRAGYRLSHEAIRSRLVPILTLRGSGFPRSASICERSTFTRRPHSSTSRMRWP